MRPLDPSTALLRDLLGASVMGGWFAQLSGWTVGACMAIASLLFMRRETRRGNP